MPAALNLGPTAGRIDVHHHLSPPAWIAVARSRGIDVLAINWTVEKSLADMDRAGVATALLSVTTPDVFREAELRMIERDTALVLLPRLRR